MVHIYHLLTKVLDILITLLNLHLLNLVLPIILKRLRLKEIQNVKLIFISSIFKKNKNFLGIYKFIKLRKLTKKKVIALGGISKLTKKN